MFLGTSIFGKQVDEKTAKLVGENFLFSRTDQQNLKSAINLKMIYKANSKSNNSLASVQPSTLFYVLSADSNGFVIVAGDDNVSPILGYSDQSSFDSENIPLNVAKWLEGYKNQIRTIIDNKISADTKIRNEWQRLKSDNNYTESSNTGVNPLIKTKWDQGDYYNALCPDGSYTGCVATAMAQIMKYWNYPETGSGFHSYRHETYGTLSANFGSTKYNWNSMPNAVNSPNNAVATLMYQVGVSVDMDYSTEGSSAYVISESSPITNCSEYAMKTYFGYSNSLRGIFRDDYTQSEWINILKSEFDNGRPVLYSGYGNEGGHCFVADGYDNNNYIHFNWGWGGDCDGYYRMDALNPVSPGIGGGNGEYNYDQDAIIGIEPISGDQTYNLILSDYVKPSYNEIYFVEPFYVTVNILNNGNGTFNGDYTAAVFDETYNIVDYIQTLSGNTLQGGYKYNNNLKFSTEGLVSMLPGTYYIGIFYRPEGGNWIEVANNGNYKNFVKIKVINPNDIELDSEMKITPGTTLTQGEPASVNLNLWNNGKTTFFGTYYVDLYNLDGTWAQSIDSIAEKKGLSSGYIYNEPYLTFSTASIDVEPGTYLLATQYKTSSGDWFIAGSTNYPNPIKVTVAAPAMQPDIYESNNTVDQSYSLPLIFSGNKAIVNSQGSNCHVTSDDDYYKVDLPYGYQYTITPRIDDSADKNNSYTLDGLFSYSIDGNKWSDAFDKTMTGNIIINGGKTLYFHVAPYFAGQTGTYLLDMSITRTSSNGVDQIDADNGIRVYPNPAKDFTEIYFNESKEESINFKLINALGQSVFSSSMNKQTKTLHVPLYNLSEGVYLMQFETTKGTSTQKLIISK